MVRFGFPAADVARFYDVSLQTVFRWVAGLEGADRAPWPVRNGAGRPSKVSPAQIARLAAIVLEHTPDRLGFGAGLWNMKLMAQLVAREWGLSLSRPTLANVMLQLGFIAPRPVYLVQQQDAPWSGPWMQAFPGMWRQGKKKGARILFADESRLDGEHYTGSEGGPVFLLSALSMTGELQFMLIQGETGAPAFQRFLQQLMIGVERPILLAVDSQPMHKDPAIEEYVRAAHGRLELCHLRLSD